MRKIIESAIKYKGKIYTGKRHNNCIEKAYKDTGDTPIIGIQGFVDSLGNFYNRETSANIAIATGQIKELKYSDKELYSEDLY